MVSERKVSGYPKALCLTSYNSVEIYHLQKGKTVKGSKNLKISSKGPLKAELSFSQAISEKSCINQVISLTCIGERIEFNSHVSWHESHQFLVSFFCTEMDELEISG